VKITSKKSFNRLELSILFLPDFKPPLQFLPSFVVILTNTLFLKKTVFISERNQMSTISSEMTKKNYRKGYVTCMNITASETEKRVLRNSHVFSFRRSTNSRPYISLFTYINKSYNSPWSEKIDKKSHVCLPHSTSGQHPGTMHDPLYVAKTVSFYQVSFYFIHNKTPNNLWKSSQL
jgi:hypothetical protein